MLNIYVEHNIQNLCRCDLLTFLVSCKNIKVLFYHTMFWRLNAENFYWPFFKLHFNPYTIFIGFIMHKNYADLNIILGHFINIRSLHSMDDIYGYVNFEISFALIYNIQMKMNTYHSHFSLRDKLHFNLMLCIYSFIFLIIDMCIFFAGQLQCRSKHSSHRIVQLLLKMCALTLDIMINTY